MQIWKNLSQFNPHTLCASHPSRSSDDVHSATIVSRYQSLVTAGSCLAAQSYLPSNLPPPAVRVIPRGLASVAVIRPEVASKCPCDFQGRGLFSSVIDGRRILLFYHPLLLVLTKL